MTELELWSYTFRRSDLVELAAAAAAAGFACVTTTPALFTRSGGHGADLRARVEDHGVRVTFVDGLCTALPGTNLPPGEPTIDECIDIAHSLGAGAINVVHATGVPTPISDIVTSKSSSAESSGTRERNALIFLCPSSGRSNTSTMRCCDGAKVSKLRLTL